MKILLLTTHLNIGGVGVYIVNLARYLKKNGIDVSVASSGGNLEHILEENGITHFTLDIKTKSEFGLKVWKVLPKLIKIITENDFQIIHAQTRVTQVLAQIVCEKTGVQFVSTCHGFFKHRRLSRKIFPCWGKKIIAISKSVRRHLLDDFNVPADKVELVYNGIELDRYAGVDKKKDDFLLRKIGLTESNMVVGAIGRLSSVKGFKYLVDAFKEVASQYENMTLMLVGEGPEEKPLRKQISDAGLSDRVVITFNDGSLEQYLSIIDIFCLPSIHEGLGLSLMEAMAAGRPSIASNVGGLSELITNGEDGILVPSMDPEALAKAIFDLVLDVSLRDRLAVNARKRAEDSFSIENSIEGTIEVYKNLLKETCNN